MGTPDSANRKISKQQWSEHQRKQKNAKKTRLHNK